MDQGKLMTVVVALMITVLVGSFCVFTVDERERAIKFRLGEIVKTDFEPGIYFKLPLVNNVRKFDARIVTLDSEPERYLTSEKKNVIVDSFVKWKIADDYTAMSGDERQANLRLSQIIRDGLRGEFGKRTIQEVVSGERAEIMTILTANAAAQAKDFGIDVVDVRIKRIDLSEDVSVWKRSVHVWQKICVRKVLKRRSVFAPMLIVNVPLLSLMRFVKQSNYVVKVMVKPPQSMPLHTPRTANSTLFTAVWTPIEIPLKIKAILWC